MQGRCKAKQIRSHGHRSRQFAAVSMQSHVHDDKSTRCLKLIGLLELHRLHSCILHIALQTRMALQARFLQYVRITISLNLAQFTSDFRNSSTLNCLSRSMTTSSKAHCSGVNVRAAGVAIEQEMRGSPPLSVRQV